ncbi:MAG TPA: TIGR02453 family protein [Gammaproteobacteria bacterium]|nr:TIGR02453 family protein [Gammaproteobacteria bacterium]
MSRSRSEIELAAGAHAFTGFSSGALAFLSELAANNDRDWFGANKDRYERFVLEPSLAFIGAIAPELRRIAPRFVAAARRSGGSLMRIHRDTRFSRNKQPYKTNVGIQFRHELGKDVHAPGFYVHIEPGDCFVGAGIWHPAADALAAIRARIADEPQAWRRAKDAGSFADRFELSGEQLRRMPRGYDATHPLADDLRRKDFIGVCEYEIGAILEPEFVAYVLDCFADARPLMRFLCAALGLRF